MPITVEIDPHSGFCGGVIRAISKAEDMLTANPDAALYSLGAVVHNEAELERLSALGLVAIDKDAMESLPEGSDVLIRAHGEPPSTYKMAKKCGINLIDCTCPVVVQLQKRIRDAYEKGSHIIIFGKVGHAEVLGLVGQVGGDALVIENEEMFRKALDDGKVPLTGTIEIFSQTTKSPSEYAKLCNALQEAIGDGGTLRVHNTICRQVASRHDQLAEFSAHHDVIVFVSGRASSNGRVLSDLCRRINSRTHVVMSEDEIDGGWFHNGDSVGVCGATSTPKWLLDAVARKILQIGDNSVILQSQEFN